MAEARWLIADVVRQKRVVHVMARRADARKRDLTIAKKRFFSGLRAPKNLALGAFAAGFVIGLWRKSGKTDDSEAEHRPRNAGDGEPETRFVEAKDHDDESSGLARLLAAAIWIDRVVSLKDKYFDDEPERVSS